MGNAPLMLTDNFYDYVLHPTFVVYNPAADDVVGQEIWRIGTNTRDIQGWTPSNTNVERKLVVDTLAANAADIVVLDRGHNLAGKTVKVMGSTDNFVTSNVVVATATIPATAGGLPTSGGNGCLTSEGVWWLEFASASYRYWALDIPAMGVGLAPIVKNLHIGTFYRFPEYITAPGADSFQTRIDYNKNQVSRGGVRIKTRPIPYSELDFSLQLEASDYPAFDAAFRPVLRLNHPMWYCLDDTDATASSLMKPYQTNGTFSFKPLLNPVHREFSIVLEEVIPMTYL